MTFLFKAVQWVVSTFFKLGLYGAWSRFCQFVWERKRSPVQRFENLSDLVSFIRTLKWRPDSWKQLWDATSHPEHVQYLTETDPSRLIGDCLPSDTLVLMGNYRTKPIGELQEGDTIMGDGTWTKVSKVWDKGVQPTLEFTLSNGNVFKCTPDHRVFVVPKKGLYAGDRAEAVEIKASEVKVDDDLLTPATLQEGCETMDKDQAWLLGLFVAEGWVEYNNDEPCRFAISGKDGYRKEANKKRAKEIFDKMGVDSYWHPKYLRVNDPALASFYAACGHLAPNKRVPSINFDKDTVGAIIEGLNADADLRDGVFSSTSSELALQMRLMYRMLGRSTGMVKVDEHGGFGTNPIYRVTPRKEDTNRKHARVRAIASGQSVGTHDISVEGGRFYLPESDIVVHNCDDFAIYEVEVWETQFKGKSNIWNIVEANMLTVTWYRSGGTDGPMGFSGHNVCLLKNKNGTFSFMDYGWPSGSFASIDEVVYAVIKQYADGATPMFWARHVRGLKCVEVKCL